ncbi:hypothetical protein ACTNEV_09270 [Oscillospiraceae bacterium HCP3S3_D12]
MSGYISDGLFDSVSAARDYAEAEETVIQKIINEGYTGYYVLDVVYSNGTIKYTVEWY